MTQSAMRLNPWPRVGRTSRIGDRVHNFSQQIRVGSGLANRPGTAHESAESVALPASGKTASAAWTVCAGSNRGKTSRHVLSAVCLLDLSGVVRCLRVAGSLASHPANALALYR